MTPGKEVRYDPREMKALWTNDIHLEFLDDRQYDDFLRRLAEAECDCLLLGGDIGTAPTILGYLNDIQRTVRKPVYFVLGNHDFYRGSISVVRTAMQELPAPRWLGGMGFVPLTQKTCLVGHDGWGDGRYGVNVRPFLSRNSASTKPSRRSSITTLAANSWGSENRAC